MPFRHFYVVLYGNGIGTTSYRYRSRTHIWTRFASSVGTCQGSFLLRPDLPSIAVTRDGVCFKLSRRSSCRSVTLRLRSCACILTVKQDSSEGRAASPICARRRYLGFTTTYFDDGARRLDSMHHSVPDANDLALSMADNPGEPARQPDAQRHGFRLPITTTSPAATRPTGSINMRRRRRRPSATTPTATSSPAAPTATSSTSRTGSSPRRRAGRCWRP